MPPEISRAITHACRRGIESATERHFSDGYHLRVVAGGHTEQCAQNLEVNIGGSRCREVTEDLQRMRRAVN